MDGGGALGDLHDGAARGGGGGGFGPAAAAAEVRRSRGWCFTSNRRDGETDEEWEAHWTQLQEQAHRWDLYMTVGKEVAPGTGRHHFQGYVHSKDPMTLEWLKGHIGRPSTHWAIARGTAAQNLIYTQKDGKGVEVGKRPEQGKRHDLDEVREAALQVDGPDALSLLQTGRIRNLQALTYFERVRALALTTAAKELTPPEVHWITGPSGTGKTHLAIAEASSGGKPYHMKTGMTKWFPDPSSPTRVVWDDFRPIYRDVEFSFILSLLGIGRVFVERKGLHVPWTCTHIWITSIKHPSECVPEGEEVEQLLRRLKTIRTLTTKRAEGWMGAVPMPQSTLTSTTFQPRSLETTTSKPPTEHWTGPAFPPSGPAASEGEGACWDISHLDLEEL